MAKSDGRGKRLWMTYMGGSFREEVHDFRVDGKGEISVAGGTSSKNFPVTASVWMKTSKGICDGIQARFDAAGSRLLYSTYLGGTKSDPVTGLCVDAKGVAYASGVTNSIGFPVTPGAHQSSLKGIGRIFTWGDAFLFILDPSMPASSQLVLSTYLGRKGG